MTEPEVRALSAVMILTRSFQFLKHGRRGELPPLPALPRKVKPTVKVVLRLHLDRQRNKRLFGKERCGPLI